jgi:hypothetical protein
MVSQIVNTFHAYYGTGTFITVFKGDKADCNNYRGISLLLTAYRILSNILLARLTPRVNEIIGDHQCEFRHNLHWADTREKMGV